MYHGARGPGKTITQLMRFRSRVGQGYGSYWRGVIFDREFKNLGDLVAQSRRFFPKFDDGCKFLSSAQEYKWVWPTGEELLFRHVKKIGDYDGFHGWEVPFLGWNELTKHPTSELYDKLMSINRSSYTPEKDGWVGSDTGYGPNGEVPPPIPLEVFITTNPSGPGHNWVKRQFIDPAPNGTIVKKEAAIFNPQTQLDEIYTKTQVAIFGSYRENKFLDPKYIAELDAITNENLRRAWLYGDWNVTAGGALDDLWNERKHVLPRFPIPRNWRIDRSMDWGSTHPFACAWWAETNGEEVILPDGRTFAPAKGSIIQIAELYATEGVGTNKGLKWGPALCAEKIIAKEKALMQGGWIVTQPWPGPADNQIRNVIDSESDTIETKFAKAGVKWTESDKSPGSRKNGLILLRDRLEAVISKPELPGLYVMTHCRDSIDTVTSIQYDEDNVEDVDCWVAGTLVATPNGSKPIELISVGEIVNTPIGPRIVEASYVSGKSKTVRVTLENGKILEGTPEHKIFVCGKGLVPLEQLQPDTFVTEEENQCLQKPHLSPL
jgi:hypothetical protein